jgi:hypothetical protein
VVFEIGWLACGLVLEDWFILLECLALGKIESGLYVEIQLVC